MNELNIIINETERRGLDNRKEFLTMFPDDSGKYNEEERWENRRLSEYYTKMNPNMDGVRALEGDADHVAQGKIGEGQQLRANITKDLVPGPQTRDGGDLLPLKKKGVKLYNIKNEIA